MMPAAAEADRRHRLASIVETPDTVWESLSVSTNDGGFLPVTQVKYALNRLGLEASASDLQTHIPKGAGEIGYNTFTSLCHSVSRAATFTEAEIRQALSLFQSVDGKLNSEEFRAALSTQRIDGKDLEAILSMAHSNKFADYIAGGWQEDAFSAAQVHQAAATIQTAERARQTRKRSDPSNPQSSCSSPNGQSVPHNNNSRPSQDPCGPSPIPSPEQSDWCQWPLFEVGSLVRICGLEVDTQLNGLTGKVFFQFPDNGEVAVLMPDPHGARGVLPHQLQQVRTPQKAGSGRQLLFDKATSERLVSNGTSGLSSNSAPPVAISGIVKSPMVSDASPKETTPESPTLKSVHVIQGSSKALNATDTEATRAMRERWESSKDRFYELSQQGSFDWVAQGLSEKDYAAEPQYWDGLPATVTARVYVPEASSTRELDVSVVGDGIEVGHIDGSTTVPLAHLMASECSAENVIVSFSAASRMLTLRVTVTPSIADPRKADVPTTGVTKRADGALVIPAAAFWKEGDNDKDSPGGTAPGERADSTLLRLLSPGSSVPPGTWVEAYSMTGDLARLNGTKGRVESMEENGDCQVSFAAGESLVPTGNLLVTMPFVGCRVEHMDAPGRRGTVSAKLREGTVPRWTVLWDNLSPSESLEAAQLRPSKYEAHDPPGALSLMSAPIDFTGPMQRAEGVWHNGLPVWLSRPHSPRPTCPAGGPNALLSNPQSKWALVKLAATPGPQKGVTEVLTVMVADRPHDGIMPAAYTGTWSRPDDPKAAPSRVVFSDGSGDKNPLDPFSRRRSSGVSVSSGPGSTILMCTALGSSDELPVIFHSIQGRWKIPDDDFPGVLIKGTQAFAVGTDGEVLEGAVPLPLTEEKDGEKMAALLGTQMVVESTTTTEIVWADGDVWTRWGGSIDASLTAANPSPKGKTPADPLSKLQGEWTDERGGVIKVSGSSVTFSGDDTAHVIETDEEGRVLLGSTVLDVRGSGKDLIVWVGGGRWRRSTDTFLTPKRSKETDKLSPSGKSTQPQNSDPRHSQESKKATPDDSAAEVMSQEVAEAPVKIPPAPDSAAEGEQKDPTPADPTPADPTPADPDPPKSSPKPKSNSCCVLM
eukprot:Hpha_TRINITY_DN15570_c5_g4::TRINITY_DN15570_c5_g4_i1::g.107313::m.107313